MFKFETNNQGFAGLDTTRQDMHKAVDMFWLQYEVFCIEYGKDPDFEWFFKIWLSLSREERDRYISSRRKVK